MQLSKKKILWSCAGVLAGMFLLAGVGYMLLLMPIHDAVAWDVKGRVFDESTNGIAGAHVMIEAFGTVNGLNWHLGMPRKVIVLNGVTDADGRFEFEFRGVDVLLVVTNSGYDEERRHFHWLSEDKHDNTNQDLRIFLTSTKPVHQ